MDSSGIHILSVCRGPDLVEFIAKNAVAHECSFCAATSDVPMAADMDDVSEHFLSCLFQEYDLAGNQLGWDGSEGGRIGRYWNHWDLALEVLELEFPQGNESKRSRQ